MGGDKSASQGSSTTVVNQSTTATPTAEETKLNQLEAARVEAVQPYQIETQKTGLSLVNKLLQGQEPLPGFFNELSQGISENMTQQMVQKSLKDVSAQGNFQGIGDSGTMFSAATRTAGDIRMGSAEYNLGNKFNLLNLALSGQAQVQAPLLAQSAELGSRLAGLRTINTQGTTTNNWSQKSSQTTGALGWMSGIGNLMSGVGGMMAASSITFKENITENKFNGLDIIKACDIINFDYKKEIADDGIRHIGVIAEDAPEILVTKDRKGIDVVNSIGILLDANKRLIKRVEELEAKSGRE